MYRTLRNYFGPVSLLFLPIRSGQLKGYSGRVQKLKTNIIPIAYRFSHLVINSGDLLPKEVVFAHWNNSFKERRDAWKSPRIDTYVFKQINNQKRTNTGRRPCLQYTNLKSRLGETMMCGKINDIKDSKFLISTQNLFIYMGNQHLGIIAYVSS